MYADAFPGLDIIATNRVRDYMVATQDTWPARFTIALGKRRSALAAKADSATRQDSTDVIDYASLTEETRTLRRVFPTITFTDSMTIRHGGREFRFMSVTGDQEGTTVLYLPHERVLLTGDAVSYPMPYVSRPLRQQVSTLKMLAELHAAVIVPGHGPAFHDNTFIDLERPFIEAVITGVAEARAHGVQSVEELQRVVTIDSLREQFAHGDADLERRYASRVKDMVSFAAAE